jgi:methylglyoxal synthase
MEIVRPLSVRAGKEREMKCQPGPHPRAEAVELVIQSLPACNKAGSPKEPDRGGISITGGTPGMDTVKTIALVAHDNRKRDLIEWVQWNYQTLTNHTMICTGTTGRLVERAIVKKLEENGLPATGFNMVKLKSGPLGGDQQLGAMIAEGKVDFVIFFWDPMQPHPHDVDVKALLRITVVYNIPTACNRATADFLISSPLMGQEYRSVQKDYAEYLKRAIPVPQAP